MTAYRSTTLKLLKHCPRAIDHAEAGTPMDREIFAAGIAAHAVLQSIGEAMKSGKPFDPVKIADAVALELVTHGRAFEGIGEPPMSPDSARDGREIALAWLATHPLSASADFELGLAVDREWRPVAYDSPEVYYRAVLDVKEVIEETDDDGYVTQVLVVEDHKSAWPTNAEELQTIQLRGQACVALAHFPQADIVRRKVNNLRTGATYAEDTYLDDTGAEEVAQWRKDIALLIAAADARESDGRRTARPGAGCLGCPYLMACDDAGEYMLMAESVIGSDLRRELATELAIADAWRARLYPLIKQACADGNIAIDGGFVGFEAKAENKPTDEAPRTLAHRWFGADSPEWDAANAQLLGLLRVAKLGNAQFEAVAKALHPFDRENPNWKAERAAFLDECLAVTTVAKFGVHVAAQEGES